MFHLSFGICCLLLVVFIYISSQEFSLEKTASKQFAPQAKIRKWTTVISKMVTRGASSIEVGTPAAHLFNQTC
jgi:hypothetical protein